MTLNRILTDLATRRRRRRTTLILASLSDGQLRDLGIDRHDLFDTRAPRPY